jgi:uncharacterized protein
MTGDFSLSVRVRGAYAAQFDQAGAMVRTDKRHWLKTGIEFVDGVMNFSTVVTHDYSSWAVSGLPAGTAEIALLVTRRGDAVEVRYSLDGADDARLAALVYLPPDAPVLAGAMCAAPDGGGFPVTFHDLTITPA